MIITFSGTKGAGKSTVADIVAEKLGYKRYSMGDLRGKMAQERGMTIDEWNAHGEQNEETDVPVDEYQRKLGETEDNFVIDGRVSWHFIPHSFKVFLQVDPEEGARRIFEHAKAGGRKDEKKYSSLEEVQEAGEVMKKSDSARYMKYYGVDITDESHYDLVIDTTNIDQHEVARQIIDKIEAKA